MKKMLMGTMLGFMLVALVGPGVVFAQEDTVTQDTTVETQPVEQTDAIRADDTATNREARLEEYKQKLTDRLTAAQERRIAAACKSAQGKVARLHNLDSEVIVSRRTTYNQIAERLELVVDKLQAASIDTAELDSAIAEMKRLAQEISTAAQEYEATLTDLEEMDCESDPEGFQAALTVAREQRVALIAQVQALREYVTQDVNSVLQTIREQLTSNDTNADTGEEV